MRHALARALVLALAAGRGRRRRACAGRAAARHPGRCAADLAGAERLAVRARAGSQGRALQRRLGAGRADAARLPRRPGRPRLRLQAGGRDGQADGRDRRAEPVHDRQLAALGQRRARRRATRRSTPTPTASSAASSPGATPAPTRRRARSCRCRRSRTSRSGTSPTAASTCCRRARAARRPPRTFARLVRACADAVHAVSPDARVAAGPIASRGAQGGAAPIAFLDAYRLAGGPRPQALALNPYMNGLVPDFKPNEKPADGAITLRNLDQLEHWLNKAYGGSVPIWFTEFAWRTAPTPKLGTISPAKQADLLRKTVTLVRTHYPYAKLLVWYLVRDESPDELLALGAGDVRLAAEARLRALQGARRHLMPAGTTAAVRCYGGIDAPPRAGPARPHGRSACREPEAHRRRLRRRRAGGRRSRARPGARDLGLPARGSALAARVPARLPGRGGAARRPRSRCRSSWAARGWTATACATPRWCSPTARSSRATTSASCPTTASSTRSARSRPAAARCTSRRPRARSR